VPLDLTAVDVSFDAPDREWSGRLTRPTVNCFLYDVRENEELREAAWDVARDNGARTVSRRKMPIRVNATYNVTVWARAPEDEHRLLWRVLTALARHPVLAGDAVFGGLKDQPFPIMARVARPEAARTNPADLWQALDNRIRPSLTYVLTLAVDPDVVWTSPMAFTTVVRTRPFDAPPSEFDELLYVAGRVMSRADSSAIGGARVLLRERGSESVTGPDGTFAFRAPRGQVTLVVEAPGRKRVSKAAAVPSPNYDLEV
jgi:Pvc16 N-terminal domain